MSVQSSHAPSLRAPFGSLVELLHHRALHQANERAYVFINDAGTELAELTFKQLDDSSRSLAKRISKLARPGDRALLVFPSGLDFLVAYFACLYAGIIAVPAVPPRRGRLRHATLGIASDCRPKLGFTSDALISNMTQEFAGEAAWDAIRWMSIKGAPDFEDETGQRSAASDEIAFLQYTSGSTSAPKGVMVSHGNLLANLEMIRHALGTTAASTCVSWMPFYHDMGLIYNALHTLYVGSMCVFMAPASFMQRPLGWLAAISKYRAEIGGGPNFGFDLCVNRFKPERVQRLDLGSWRVAFNGAEPVRARTLQRFSETFAAFGFDRRAFYPCYGMAEGTLLLSGGSRDALPVIRGFERSDLARGRVAPVDDISPDCSHVVGCGSSVVGQSLIIVDPVACRECGPGEIGEIWVAGPHVAAGYWCNPAATHETFEGVVAGTGAGPFLRTGDAGFILDGELFISGRIKDVIIIRGQNHYPQDIEATVGACHPAFRENFGVAFAIGEPGEERLVVIQEVERTWRASLNPINLVESVRAAVVAEHELMVSELVLIRTGTLPKTSSGKVQRRGTRQLYIDGQLELWQAVSAEVELSTSPT
ncbi:MAG TPA: fatty acyl-AMP ligase [Bradyrhizobium sp.]|jgi:acyl-CoA synthetase (AMP-forming)/AMP-acid ligase II|nr:fatty acyl-AMP ligase [Bradyrhizobium sp.]